MKKRPLLYFILLIFWLLHVGSIAGLGRFIYTQFVTHQTEQTEASTYEQLVQLTALLPQTWIAAEQHQLFTEVFESLDTTPKLHLSAIMPDGKAYGANVSSDPSFESGIERKEIQQALQGYRGIAYRYDTQLEDEVLYIAHPVFDQHQEPIYAVRAAVSLDAQRKKMEEIKQKISLCCIGVALLSLILAICLCRYITRPLKKMTQIATHFSNQNYTYRMPPHAIREVDELADTLNLLSENLNQNLVSLNEQRAEQQAVLTSMTEGVLAIDRKERIIHMNKAAKHILDIPTDQPIKGRFIQEVIRNTQLHTFIKRILFTKKTLAKDLQLAGVINKHIQITGSRLSYPNEEDIGGLFVMRDLTQVRYLEQVRSDFVANVSHELKTPITSIKGWVETLQGDGFSYDTKTKECLSIIRDQSNRLNAIIDDLLTLSRLERKDGHIVKSACSLHSLITNAISLCALYATDREAPIEIDCAKELMAECNEHLMEQALVNLIINAIKYSEKGCLINISASIRDNQVYLAVKDQGFGIEAKHHARLFERFYRIDSARSRQTGGTGLGLSIVNHIMQNHQGEVQLESVVGEGSTFTLLFPAS